MEVIPLIPITALYAGFNALIMLCLAALVVRGRRKYSIGLGDGGEEKMLAAIRAHGNNVEYVPVALLLILVLELMGAWGWTLHLLGAALTVARIAHGYGLTKTAGSSAGRVMGTLVTWIVILVGALECLYLGVG